MRVHVAGSAAKATGGGQLMPHLAQTQCAVHTMHARHTMRGDAPVLLEVLLLKVVAALRGQEVHIRQQAVAEGHDVGHRLHHVPRATQQGRARKLLV